MIKENLQPQIPEHIAREIDQWIKRYPTDEKRSGVFEALRLVQEHAGHLTTEWMNAVADYLGMPHIAVYEIATFYTMYYLKPVGKHVINVCTNVSCNLNGASELAAYLQKKLGIKFDETTADGRFTLKEVECLGACIAPPVVMIDKTYHEKVTPENVDSILAKVGE